MVRTQAALPLHPEDEPIELQDLWRVLLPADAERLGLVRRLYQEEEMGIAA